MDIYISLFLNITFIMFPLCLCLICISNSQKLDEKTNTIYLDLALITMCYLISNLVDRGSFFGLYLLNVPLVLAYKNKRTITSIIISIILIVYYDKIFDINICYFIIEYTVYFFVNYIFQNKNIKGIGSIASIASIKSIILSVLILYSQIQYKTKWFLLFSSVIFVCLTVLTIYLFKKTEENLIFKRKFLELEHEKEIRNSLFQITHEIKNPITVCKGYLDMFDVNNIEHSKKYIPKIKNEINRVLILLEDFLSIKKLKIDKDIMDINMLVEDISENFKDIFMGKRIKGIFDIDQNEVFVNGDYNRLSQVLINVVKNSIESLDKDIKIIKISTNANKNYAKIIIEDNGKGMNEDELRKICKPFFSTKSSGTGLGLYLSNEIIKEHNGSMMCESKENIGTKLTICLPIKKDIKIS